MQLIDISESGFSFVIPAELFEIGEKFQIQMGLSNDQLFLTQGQITAQHVYFPFGAEHFQKAVYRFSGTFEKSLDKQKFEEIRLEIHAGKAA